MISRMFRFSLALAWLLFAAIIVPAHTRGYITWGKSESQGSCGSCCESKPQGKNNSKQPSEEDKKHCAVCFTVALFDMPPAFIIYSNYLGDAQRVSLARPASPAYRLIPLTYHSRAPPALSPDLASIPNS